MCGICGFTGQPDDRLLRRMNQRIFHRGPDEDGFYVDGAVNLAMRRLSIIDLETGKQPIGNEAETVWTVYNGEIYNFQDLREGLEKKGHVFHTRTDTEVIPHLYEEHGDDFVHKLNGMFAIALWDQPRKRLLLYRDRMGIKPLYYAERNGELIFASEVKCILLHPDVKKEMDAEAIHHYFSFKNVPEPRTAFRDVWSLLPGEMAVFEDGRFEKRRYWRLRFNENPDLTEQDAASRIIEILEDAVRIRMVSDVPIGAYLSGGLDSSTVVALLSRFMDRPVTTFCLGYEDEFQHKEADIVNARRASELFKSDHHEYIMSAREVAEDADAVLDAFDAPFGGVTSTFFLTKLIRQHVVVALSGDGADELFGSYRAHRLARPIAVYLRHKRNGTLDKLDPALLAPFDNEPEYVAALADEEPWRWRMKLYVFSDEEKQLLYAPEMRRMMNGFRTEELLRDYYFARTTAEDPLNQILEIDWMNLLTDQVLAFVDRLSMAHSIEVRPPYLDYRLVEFVSTIPSHMKIRGSVVKYIMKEAARGVLPDEMIDRPKEGFVLPVYNWMATSLRPWIEDILAPARLKRRGLLDAEYAQSLLGSFSAERKENAGKIWNLAMFQLWHEHTF